MPLPALPRPPRPTLRPLPGPGGRPRPAGRLPGSDPTRTPGRPAEPGAEPGAPREPRPAGRTPRAPGRSPRALLPAAGPGGRGAKGRGPPGARRPQDHKGSVRRNVPTTTNLGVSLQRGHLESNQYSRPPAPLPPAVSSPCPTLSSKNTAEAEEFPTKPTATVSHWGRRRQEFWVRVPPSCPAERREDL